MVMLAGPYRRIRSGHHLDWVEGVGVPGENRWCMRGCKSSQPHHGLGEFLGVAGVRQTDEPLAYRAEGIAGDYRDVFVMQQARAEGLAVHTRAADVDEGVERPLGVNGVEPVRLT